MLSVEAADRRSLKTGVGAHMAARGAEAACRWLSTQYPGAQHLRTWYPGTQEQDDPLKATSESVKTEHQNSWIRVS